VHLSGDLRHEVARGEWWDCQENGVTDLVGVLPLSGGQASFEGDLEGVEGGFPAGDPAFLALAGGVQAHHGHVHALECGLLVREVAASPYGFPDARVDALDGVCAARGWAVRRRRIPS
jgi:hypothetical protein